MAKNADYVSLGLVCADVCRALDRGTGGKRLDDLSQPVLEAIDQLTTWVEPVTRGFDISLIILIAVLWPRSRRRSPKVLDGVYFSDLSMRRGIGRWLLDGIQTSTGLSMSSAYVQPGLFRSR